jgi:hypothetical protein
MVPRTTRPSKVDPEDGEVQESRVRPISSLRKKPVVWLWKRYLAEGMLTLMDGEKGKGKTFLGLDIAARLSNGEPMPGEEDDGYGEPRNVIIFGEEDSEGVLAARAEAAEMDVSRVFIRATPKLKRGEVASGQEYALPGGAANIGRAIREARACLAIFDPITDFIAEDIRTHNDASVRRALLPLGAELAKLGVAGWAYRHMNKQQGIDARMRGSGSTAFQNRARIHLAVGSLPEALRSYGQFGLSILDTNVTRRPPGVQAYSLEDSDVLMDDGDTYAARVAWGEYLEDVDANSMLAGPPARRRGPSPDLRDEAADVLREIFEGADTLLVEKVLASVRASGCPASKKTIDAARKEMGLVPRQLSDGWHWGYPAKFRVRRNG